MVDQDADAALDVIVSVLFSEPKIPQFNLTVPTAAIEYCVSVLFSEPKIPQSIGQSPSSSR